MDRLLINILAGAISGAVILLLSIFLIVRCCRRRQQLPSTTTIPFTETPTRSLDSFHASLHKLHLSYKSSTSKSSLRFHHLHHPHHHPDPQQQIIQQWIPFIWDDHPELIDEAAEHGWARFTFTSRPTAASKPSTPLLGLCTVCDVGSQKDMTEVDWKLPAGAPELMQTIRLKPGTKKADDFASIRMSLPLPGPQLGGSSFPQEAYFEITILVLQPQQNRRKSSRRVGGGGDRSKLIQENPTTALVPSPLQDTKSAHEEDSKQTDCLISLGFVVGESSSTNKWMPGTYPGSIGFCSNGSVHLDGMKLVFESERGEWAGVNRVIGCGFNPSKKKVFLTVDSELVHVISCNSDVYKSPLYPVVAAAKADVMVLINLGQRAFKYAPANASRTPNPCFLRSPSQDGGSGFFHSRELFLLGRISTEECFDITRGSSSKKEDDCRVDIDADSELFEISLNR